MDLKIFPKINFATADPRILEEECLKVVEEYLGRPLERADPLRIFLKALLAIIIQQRLLIDYTAKMNLLPFSEKKYLDALGVLVGCERLPSAFAVTTVEVTLSAPREVTTIIRADTRITADDEIFFALDDDVIFAAGEIKKSARATCLEPGVIANGFKAGEIKKIVDPQAFLLSIINVTTSDGGADVEDDDSYRQRIRDSLEGFSVAGSIGAYEYHAKSVSQLISDVAVDSPVPGEVNVYLLMQNGALPSEEIIQAVYDHLSDKTVRPLTDLVRVLPPTVQSYNVDVDYYINRQDAVQSAQIVKQVDSAVKDYLIWQKEKIGRDINPSELIYRVKAAGAKRVVVRSPQFLALDSFSVAQEGSVNIYFEGLEDD